MTVGAPDNRALLQLMRAIGAGDREASMRLVAARPDLATTSLAKAPRTEPSDECFLETCAVQIYVGHTALHVAASRYDLATASSLVAAGADVRAKNRRGAEPLHAATNGSPGSPQWNPEAQVAMITYLIQAGADPEALAEGGVTPLQRAVRNRCSAAVHVLLDADADPHRPNRNGSTAFTLATWTTGRGGTGSAAAKHEQTQIIRLLQRSQSTGTT